MDYEIVCTTAVDRIARYPFVGHRSKDRAVQFGRVSSMSDLRVQLERLKAAQKELLDSSAEAGGLPSDKTLSKIADLEIAIGAFEAAIEGGD